MTNDAVQRALAAMAARRALLVGDLMLDAYLYGETVRVSREAPVLVVRKERTEARLGGAANTAANLQALGVQTEVVGVAGQDEAGQQLVHMLRAGGSGVAGVQRPARTTPVKTRVLAGAVGTSKQQVLRLDDEPQAPLDAAVHAALAAEVAHRAAGVDVVVVSDYGGGALSDGLVRVLQELVRSGMPVCVDSRYQLRRFAGMTALTPNLPEAEAAVGFCIDGPADLLRAGEQLRRGLECEALLITQGQGGMTLFENGQASRHVGIVGAKEVTDVTGAGDTVIATLSAALAAGIGVYNGMLLANCAAGVVVGKTGAACASPAEIATAAKRGALEMQPWP